MYSSTYCSPIDPVATRGCTDVVGQTPVESISARPITTIRLPSVGFPPSFTTPSSQTPSRNEISETTHSGCPADLTSCTLCHVADSLKPEGVPNKPTQTAGTWKRTLRVTNGPMDGFATSRANTGAPISPSHGSPVSILCTDPILGVDPRRCQVSYLAQARALKQCLIFPPACLRSVLNGKSFVRALAALLIVSMPSPDRREGISLAW